MEQFTYSALKKLDSREEMLNENVSRLGTQSGQYGVFQEQARILTLNGARLIRQELKNAGVDWESIKTLSSLIE